MDNIRYSDIIDNIVHSKYTVYEDKVILLDIKNIRLLGLNNMLTNLFIEITDDKVISYIKDIVDSIACSHILSSEDTSDIESLLYNIIETTNQNLLDSKISCTLEYNMDLVSSLSRFMIKYREEVLNMIYNNIPKDSVPINIHDIDHIQYSKIWFSLGVIDHKTVKDNNLLDVKIKILMIGEQRK